MGLIGGSLGYRVLAAIAPASDYGNRTGIVNEDEDADSMLDAFFGLDFHELIQGKTVVDFGCGDGIQSVDMAKLGAQKVIGVDIQQSRLDRAAQRAQMHGVGETCHFSLRCDEKVDVVISKDAFEHFEDPAGVLSTMAELLKPEGYVLASFGPTWLHPYGGHLFSVFPWSHLIFTENSQIRWRSDFRSDGATCFSEVDGGLNQLTIKQFERFVADSPLQVEWLDTLPIRGLKFFKARLFREFFSSIVQCKLTLK